MILITGGVFQGKRAFALGLTGLSDEQITDGAACEKGAIESAGVLDNLEQYLKRFPEEMEDHEGFAERIYEANPDLVIISQEMGCGIVPMDKEDRLWRQGCGRCSIDLAAKSQEVYRVICGIGTRIK